MATNNMTALHICTAESCPEGANYFVTAIDGGTVYYMAGPYSTHQAALDAVRPATDIASDRDARGCFMAWGTAKSKRLKPGSITKAGLL